MRTQLMRKRKLISTYFISSLQYLVLKWIFNRISIIVSSRQNQHEFKCKCKQKDTKYSSLYWLQHIHRRCEKILQIPIRYEILNSHYNHLFKSTRSVEILEVTHPKLLIPEKRYQCIHTKPNRKNFRLVSIRSTRKSLVTVPNFGYSNRKVRIFATQK